MPARSARWRLAATVALLLLATPAGAQRYQVDTYSESNGLPSNQVSRLAQAPDGRLWVASRGGAAEYDGSSWVHHAELGARLGPGVLEILFDESGRTWAVGEGARDLFAWRDPGGSWEYAPRSAGPGSPVDADLSSGPRPTLAILEDQGGLDLVRPGQPPRHLQLPTTGRGAFAVEWHDGHFLALAMGGLWRVDPGVAEPSPVALDLSGCPHPRGLVHDPHRDELWVVGVTALHRVEGDSLGRRIEHSGLGSDRTSGRICGHATEEGSIYLGSWEGVLRLYVGGGEVLSLDRSSGLIADGANDILRDRAGNLWIATARGLSKVVSFELASLDADHGLFEDEVSALCPLPDGRLLAGHPSGLTLLEGGRAVRGWRLPATGPATRVLDLEALPDGRAAVAGSRAGLLRWDGEGPVVRVDGPWGDGPVHSARFGPDGELRVASHAIYARDGRGRWRQEPMGVRPGETPPANDYLRRLVRGRSGALYAVSGFRGAFRLEDQRWEPLGPLPPAPFSNCYAVAEESPGSWLLGTLGGLVRVNADGWSAVGVFGGDRERPIYAILPLEDGWLLGHDNGVSLWDGRRTIYHRDAPDGLAGNEINRAALLAGSRGEVYIGSDRGLTTMRPWLRRPAPAPPTARVARVEHGGRRVAGDDGRLELPRNPQPLVIGLDIVELTDEEAVRIRYRLGGLHEGWRELELGRRRTLEFPWLPPGRHALELQAAAWGPAWSAPTRALELDVPGPVWRSPWFLLLTLVGLGGLVAVASGFLAQRRYTARLGREVDERTRELALSREQIAAERQRLETTLGSISEGVLATDGEGRVAFLNPAAGRILACEPAEQLGRPLGSLLPALDLDGQVLPDGMSAVREDGSFRVELGGRERALEFSAMPLRDGGAGPGRGKVFALRDVTEARQLESEARRSERLASLGVLAGGIAHDFNNLLAVVLGNLSLLRANGELDDRGELHEAERAAERARGLTQQLLTFARGGAPVTREDDLASVVRESVGFVLSGSPVRAELDLPEDLWTAFIDADQISQVLNNLLLNAQEAMPDGGRVVVRARNLEKGPEPLAEGPCVQLEVSDDGPGIAPEHRPHVFDPYFTTKPGGSGLGLSGAYSIVARHGGQLHLDAAPGGGCCFRIHLPATGRTRAAAGPASPGPAPAVAPLGILVMDDDDAVRRVAVSMLRAQGHRVDGVADGEEMLHLYRQALAVEHPYDVVVMDLTIPGGMGGKDAMQELLAIDPGACGIVVSGYSHDAVMSQPAAHGFCAAVAKPFRPEDLEEAIAAAVAGRTARRVDHEGGTD